MEGANEVEGKRKRTRPPRGAGRRTIRPHGHTHPFEVRRPRKDRGPDGARTPDARPGGGPGLCPRNSFACNARYGLANLPGATVVDFVAARTSSFNRVQYQRENRLLKTRELRGAILGREPGCKPDSRHY